MAENELQGASGAMNPENKFAPREATLEEKFLLVDALVKDGWPRESLILDDEPVGQGGGPMEGVYTAVWEHYITGSPGFAGKVLTLIYDGAPNFYQVFTWDRDAQTWVRQEQEEGF